jgi:hypothetical protein
MQVGRSCISIDIVILKIWSTSDFTACLRQQGCGRRHCSRRRESQQRGHAAGALIRPARAGGRGEESEHTSLDWAFPYMLVTESGAPPSLSPSPCSLLSWDAGTRHYRPI